MHILDSSKFGYTLLNTLNYKVCSFEFEFEYPGKSFENGKMFVDLFSEILVVILI